MLRDQGVRGWDAPVDHRRGGRGVSRTGPSSRENAGSWPRGDGQRHREPRGPLPGPRFGGTFRGFRTSPSAGTALHMDRLSWGEGRLPPCCWWGPRCPSRPRPGGSAVAGESIPITASSAMGPGRIRRSAPRGPRDSVPGASPAAGRTAPCCPRRSSTGSGRSARLGAGATRTSARRASCRGPTDMGRAARRGIARRSPSVPAASVSASRCPSPAPDPWPRSRRGARPGPSGGASAAGRSCGSWLRRPRAGRARGPWARGSRSAPCRASRRRSRD